MGITRDTLSMLSFFAKAFSDYIPVLRAKLLQGLAQNAESTRAYAADLGTQNIQATQDMQDRFVQEINALLNSSRTSLAALEEQGSANARAISDAQIAAAEARKAEALTDMAVTTGWTVAVVVTILLAVLGASAWGTTQVANALNHIIRLMEDVADMKVENLSVPQGAHLREVARIQSAFQVLVLRLAEYKSYIPVGVFERRQQYERTDDTEDGHTTDQGVPAAESRRASSRASAASATAHAPVRPIGVPAAQQRSTKKSVAVLSVNVSSLVDILEHGEGLPTGIFNEYVTLVHESVSLSRGNVDFLAGDQVIITFNAHLPCSDPAGTATNAAHELRQLLLQKFGRRLKFNMMLSFGLVLANTVGYSKFKFMATLGHPMKVAAVLPHRFEKLDSGTILVDANIQERMKYSFQFRPMGLLYLPWMKSFAKDTSTSHRIFILDSKKVLDEDEWLYQVGAAEESSDWDKALERLAAAPSAAEAQGVVDQYVADHPLDYVALQLREHMVPWVPGLGLAM
eukprot:EG_transcript_617